MPGPCIAVPTLPIHPAAGWRAAGGRARTWSSRVPGIRVRRCAVGVRGACTQAGMAVTAHGAP